MRRHFSHQIAAFALLGGLLLAACGSSGGSSKAQSGPPLTKQQFIQQVNAICKKYNDQLDAQSNGLNSASGSQAIADFITKQILPTGKAEVDEIRALRPPSADQAKVSKMLDDLSSGLDELASNAKSNPVTALQKEPAGLKSASDAAKAYGLGQCADSSS